MYDPSKLYSCAFIGGPLNATEHAVIPAHRLTFPRTTPDGKFIKNDIYNLREIVDEKTADVLQLQYVYQP